MIPPNDWRKPFAIQQLAQFVLAVLYCPGRRLEVCWWQARLAFWQAVRWTFVLVASPLIALALLVVVFVVGPLLALLWPER